MQITKIKFEIIRYTCGKEIANRFMIWDELGSYNEWYLCSSTPFENGEMPDYWEAERLEPIVIQKKISWIEANTIHYINDTDRNSTQYRGVEDKNYLCYAGMNKGKL